DPFDLAENDVERFAGAIVARGDAAEEQAGVLEGREVAVDRIGKPALFPHFAEEPRLEAAAAENVVQHEGGDKIRIAALQPEAAEGDNSWWYFQRDCFAPAEALRLDVGDRRGIAARGQAGKGAIEEVCEFGGLDVADDRDLQVRAREHPADISA